MSREDSAVWRRFLLERGNDLIGVAVNYDVQVAVKRDEALGQPTPYEQMWQTLRSKRIDAVLTSSKEHVICEVKPTFTASGLGQLLTYRYWFHIDHTPVLPVAMLAVCYRVDRDLIPLLEAYDVRLLTLAP